MRSQRANEIGLLVIVLLLTAVAITPLARTDPPCTHDGGLHYFRIVAIRHALEDGLPISRWMPDLAFGYGNPFLNYRAALSYYAGLALYLTGMSLPLALNMVYVLSLVGSAVGAYLLGRDLFGRWAGLVAAVAYVYAPYPLIDALVRGNMPESLALAVMPFTMWAFRRLLVSGQTRYLLVSAGSLALLSLTHNISSLLFVPFLGLYLLVTWLARRRHGHLGAVCAALAMGLGLTAFYWAPAVLETNQVQLYLSRTTRTNDYHQNFVSLSEVLAPPELADPALLNPPLRLPLGLPLAVIALLGTSLALWRWRTALTEPRGKSASDLERWASVVFFALSSIVMIFMATRASLPIWENLPLIAFVQFPWRFIGRAILPLSLLAAALVPTLTRTPDTEYPIPNTQYPISNPQYLTPPPPSLTALTIAALLILAGLPSTYPATGYCPTKPQPDILDLFAYEHSTGLVGVDPLGSYFPVTVQARPTGSPLEVQYAAALSEPDQDGAPIARFDAESLPDGAVIHRAEYGPNRARLEIETPSAARVRYLTFAFPGWRVQIDGRPAEVIPSDPEGLITFDLPAGRHAVVIDWGSTALRAVATMVSLVALAGAAFVAYTAARGYLAGWIKDERAAGQVDAPTRATSQAPPEAVGRDAPVAAMSWRGMAMLALLALALLVLRLTAADQPPTIFRRSGLSADGALPGLDIPLDVRYDDGVRLLGYDRSVERMPADGVLHLAFYWTAYTRPSHDYQSTVALVGTDGQLWSGKTAFPRRGYADPPPSQSWGDGRYAVEGLDVEPLPGTPPGRYDLLLTTFDRETLAPLNVLNQSDQVSGPNLILGQVTLARPSRSPDPADVPMQIRLAADLGALSLAGVNLDRDEAAPGDPILVTLFWQGAKDPPDLRAHLALVDEEHTEAMAWDLPPVRDDWPTTSWQPGDLWRGQHLLRLPAGLESGIYTWQLSLYQPSGPELRIPASPVVLGQLSVNAPERLWEAPPLQLSLDADLGQRVTLLGADLEPATAIAAGLRPATTLTVTLAWQARAEMPISYRVFLHLLTPEGNVLAQSDGEPVGWTRPTTGWAPGEVVLDRRVLSIPDDAAPGPYSLVAGFYDPVTGDRLSLPDGANAVGIAPLTVQEP